MALPNVTEEWDFFIDPQRCIGCCACMAACSECGTHKGESMIHVDPYDLAQTTKTGPTVCMHCDDPSCVAVCPADAIKRSDDGVVQSALKSRCIGCSNCELACPFGVPNIKSESALMMKCDLCYDRTSVDLKPLCATVCPSGALFFGARSTIAEMRRNKPNNQFKFGNQLITTKVYMMVADESAPLHLNVIDFISSSVDGSEPWV